MNLLCFGYKWGDFKVGWVGANYCVFSSDHEFFHVASSSTGTTLIVKRIVKHERQIIDGKLTLVDDNGKRLPKAISMANANSDSEVEDVVNEHAIFIASTSLNVAMIVDMILIAC
ncbi:hypothetical protein Tco_0387184 [Tanacetum coccineum]